MHAKVAQRVWGLCITQRLFPQLMSDPQLTMLCGVASV